MKKAQIWANEHPEEASKIPPILSELPPPEAIIILERRLFLKKTSRSGSMIWWLTVNLKKAKSKFPISLHTGLKK
jgi:hypothetical protein